MNGEIEMEDIAKKWHRCSDTQLAGSWGKKEEGVHKTQGLVAYEKEIKGNRYKAIDRGHFSRLLMAWKNG